MLAGGPVGVNKEAAHASRQRRAPRARVQPRRTGWLARIAAVKLESSFEVPVAPEQAWELLMDVPRVIPCMPGATLTETIDDSSWKAEVRVKLGPISLTFDTDVKRESADEAARRARLSAQARESRGRGAAQATIESWLSAHDGGTRVEVATDLMLTGPVAQYGRGVIEDVSTQLVQSFADCLKTRLVAAPEQAEAAVAAQAVPVEGLELGIPAARRELTRLAHRAVAAARAKPVVALGVGLGLAAFLRALSRRARRSS
jgi:carbon monoxide dehydrogenase subunit G